MNIDYNSIEDNDETRLIFYRKENGQAFLTVSQENKTLSFSLNPNKLGLSNAEKIITNLKTWMEHVADANLIVDDNVIWDHTIEVI